MFDTRPNARPMGFQPTPGAGSVVSNDLIWDMTNGSGVQTLLPGADGIARNPMQYSAPETSWRPPVIPGSARAQSGGNGFMNFLGDTDKMQGLGTVLQGLGTLGQVWMGLQANKIARKQLDFQKDAYKTNLKNQTHSYNSQVQDRANSMAAYHQDDSYKTSYYDRHRLPE